MGEVGMSLKNLTTDFTDFTDALTDQGKPGKGEIQSKGCPSSAPKAFGATEGGKAEC